MCKCTLENDSLNSSLLVDLDLSIILWSTALEISIQVAVGNKDHIKERKSETRLH